MKGSAFLLLLISFLPTLGWGMDFVLVNSPTAYLDRSGSFRLSGRVSWDLETSNISLCSAIWRMECEIGLSVQEETVTPLLNAKVLLIRERGAIPSLAIGIADERPYLAVSKKLNLPYLGLFSIHIGSDRDAPFGGMVKRFEIPSLESRLRLAAEWYRDEASFSIRLESRYGAEMGVILEADKKPGRETIVAEVGFSSEEIISRIEGAQRLARQVGRLAAEALGRLSR
jgi:hypothetical protein